MIKQRLEDADLKCSQKAPVYYIVGVFQVQRLNALHSRQLPGCLGPKPVQLKAQHKTRGGEGCIWGPRVVSGRIVVLNSLRRRTPSSTHPQFLYGWQNVLEHPQAVYRVVDLEACEVGRARGVKVVKVQAIAAQVGERAGQLQTHWGNHRKLKTSPLAVRLRMGAYSTASITSSSASSTPVPVTAASECPPYQYRSTVYTPYQYHPYQYL